MKIKLDTINKTIDLEESVNLNDLFNHLNIFLPNNLWKEYTLNMNATIYWTNPIVIETPVYPHSPTTIPYPWITYQSGTGDNEFIKEPTITSGVYCIETKIQ